MLRTRITLLVLVLLPALAYIVGLSWRSWQYRPSSAEDMIASMAVPEGFAVELVAQEPAITHPLAMTFDERGRLWMIESPTSAADGTLRAPGRIKILESSRGDGHFDRVTPFPAHLKMPSAVAIGHGGVWVVDAPQLLFFPVHQDVVGPPEVVLTGFGQQNTNGLPNSLTWGPDGWLYGLSSVWCNNRIVHQGKTFEFSCALFRLQPRTHAFELFCEGTSNPWGLTWDTEGSAFVSTCVIGHLWHLTETGVYSRLSGVNPPYSWPIGSIVQYRHTGHSHCGLHFFDSEAYPPAYRDKLYMGNVTYSAVNIDGLERDGATYRGTPTPDFLTCPSRWFTPVAQKTGPDGLLYILDWHDRDHTGPDQLRRARTVEEPLGRLLRVRYGATYQPAGRFDLATESDEQLVRRLYSPNLYFRETAQRLLAEHTNPTRQGLLEQLVRDDREPRKARLHALWALIGANALLPECHRELLDQADPTFRAWGVRAAGNAHQVVPAIREKVIALAKDPAPEVRLQVAIAVRKIDGLDPLPVLIRLAIGSGSDRLLPPIVWQNLLPLLAERGSEFLAIVEKLSPTEATALQPIMARALEYLAARPGLSENQLLVRFQNLAAKGPVDTAKLGAVMTSLTDKIQSGNIDAQRRASLQTDAQASIHQLLQAQMDGPVYLQAVLLGATLHDPEGSKLARQIFRSTDQSEQRRLQALAALIAGRDEKLLQNLAPVLRKSAGNSLSFRRQVLATLGRSDDARIATQVLACFGQLEADLQPQAIELLIQRVAWSKQLLHAIHEKRVPATALHLNQVRQLLHVPDPELVEQVQNQWGAVREERNPEREQVVAHMRNLLKQQRGNPLNGMKVFGKLCGQCHKIYGEGAEIGPDLTSAGRSAYDPLLAKVFDPNQFIKAGFQAVTVYTTQGRSLTGLRVEDNASRVVLKIPGGKTEIIPRSQVETLVVSRVSLMPEGMEAQLRPEEWADLFAFLTLDRPPQDPGARKIAGTPP